MNGLIKPLICMSMAAMLLAACSANGPGGKPIQGAESSMGLPIQGAESSMGLPIQGAESIQSAQSSMSPPTITATSPTPDTTATPLPIQTIHSSTDKRAWRNYLYIPIETLPDTTIQQGDCKTTYTPIQTTGIKDKEFKAWLDGEIASFIDGILQDESGIQKTKQQFKDKGLDKAYPGSTFLRGVNIQAYSSGGVLSLQATDYTVYRPTDADIEKEQLGWRDGDGTLRYAYEQGFITSDTNGTVKCAEAYTYTLKTKCLNMLERKSMQLIDVLRGEAGLQKLNLAISRQIAGMNLEAGEVLKRPFTGLGADYECFSIQNYGPGTTYISIGFNEGNPWFNLQSPGWWSAYRQIGMELSGQGAMPNPILYDDSLLPRLEKRGSGESMYGAEQGKKYLPDLGLAEYAITNGGKQVRITSLPDRDANTPASEHVLDKINTGIEAFEKKYLSDTYILGQLYFPEVQVKPGDPMYKERVANRPGYSASVEEAGNILVINYHVIVNMSQAFLGIAFDLNTGNQLTAMDLMTKERPDSKEYNDIKGKQIGTYISLNRYGEITLFYERDVKAEERKWASRVSQFALPEQYFDWEKWVKSIASVIDHANCYCNLEVPANL